MRRCACDFIEPFWRVMYPGVDCEEMVQTVGLAGMGRTGGGKGKSSVIRGRTRVRPGKQFEILRGCCGGGT